MKTGIRLDEYMKKKSLEKEKGVLPDNNEKQSSPAGATSTEEIRIFNEYMGQVNLRNITEAAPARKRPLLLKKFFKMKRNQQVEIISLKENERINTTGKVTAVGRDFVMITNLKDRIWIPYQQIESANIPTGTPTYENSHQNFIYDNDLRKKLLTRFGQIVSKRDVYIQQFYEETLQTNLHSWEGTWVKIETATNTFYGKINASVNNSVSLSLLKEQMSIATNDIIYVSSLRFLTLATMISKKWFHSLSR